MLYDLRFKNILSSNKVVLLRHLWEEMYRDHGVRSVAIFKDLARENFLLLLRRSCDPEIPIFLKTIGIRFGDIAPKEFPIRHLGVANYHKLKCFMNSCMHDNILHARILVYCYEVARVVIQISVERDNFKKLSNELLIIIYCQMEQVKYLFPVKILGKIFYQSLTSWNSGNGKSDYQKGLKLLQKAVFESPYSLSGCAIRTVEDANIVERITLAIKSGNLTLLHKLDFEGIAIDRNYVNPNGETYLNLAVDFAPKIIVKFLLDQGHKPNFQPNNKPNNLERALLRRDTDILELLLKFRLNPKNPISNGQSPLAFARNTNQHLAYILLKNYSRDSNPILAKSM